MKKWKILVVILVLCFVAYYFIPSHLKFKNTVEVYNSTRACKVFLLTDSLQFFKQKNLMLYKQDSEASSLFSDNLNKTYKHLVRLEILENLTPRETQLAKENSKIEMTWSVLGTFFSKFWIWINYMSFKNEAEVFSQSLADHLNDNNFIYHISGEVRGIKDTLSYVRQVVIKAEEKKDNFFILENLMKETLSFAEEYQLFPGTFAYSLRENMLQYAWISNVDLSKTPSPYTKKAMPSFGLMYCSNKKRFSLDSIYILQKRLSQLASDKGFSLAALPFIKIYNLQQEDRKILAEIYVPID